MHLQQTNFATMFSVNTPIFIEILYLLVKMFENSSTANLLFVGDSYLKYTTLKYFGQSMENTINESMII